MSSLAKNVSVNDLLDWLEGSGLVSRPARVASEEHVTTGKNSEALPIYSQVLSGMGAFIAAICLIAALDLFNIISGGSVTSLLVSGVIALLIGVVIGRLAVHVNYEFCRLFIVQFSTCLIMGGKLLIALGLSNSSYFDGMTGAALGLGVSGIFTYLLFPSALDRFLTAYGFVFSAWFAVVDEFHFSSSDSLINNLCLIGIGLAGILLFASRRGRLHFRWEAYATLTALGSITLVLLTRNEIQRWWLGSRFVDLRIFTAGLAFLLIYLIICASRRAPHLNFEASAAAICGAALFGCLLNCGVILSLCLLVVGYTYYEKPLTLLGLILLPLSILIYYYDLQVTLLMKSFILVACGTVLLLGDYYIKIRNFDKG